MFEETKNVTPPSAPGPVSPLTPAEPPVERDDAVMHTMPEKFLGDHPNEQPGGSKKRWIVIAVVAVVVVGLGAVAVVLFNNLISSNANQNQTTNTVSNTNVNSNANANENTNVNANGNGNVNTNGSTNTNRSTNGNSNANANTNVATNANVNTNANRNANTNTVVIVPSSQDSDSDGLTDVEETLFGSDSAKPDTDGDSFLDGAEVSGGYDPTAAEGARAVTAGLVKNYTNPTYNYSTIYPTSWIAQATGEENREIVFSSATGEFVQMLVEANPSGLSPIAWYLSQVPGVQASEIGSVTVGTLTGAMSIDQSTVYLGSGENIYVITYNVGTRATANFKTTFAMMYKAFTFTAPATTNSNVNVNSNANSNTNGSVNTNAASTSNSSY